MSDDKALREMFDTAVMRAYQKICATGLSSRISRRDVEDIIAAAEIIVPSPSPGPDVVVVPRKLTPEIACALESAALSTSDGGKAELIRYLQPIWDAALAAAPITAAPEEDAWYDHEGNEIHGSGAIAAKSIAPEGDRNAVIEAFEKLRMSLPSLTGRALADFAMIDRALKSKPTPPAEGVDRIISEDELLTGLKTDDHPPPVGDAEISEAGARYLKAILSEWYNNWTENAEAFVECGRLAEAGYCRIVWDGPKCWRVYVSVDQHDKGRAALQAYEAAKAGRK